MMNQTLSTPDGAETWYPNRDDWGIDEATLRRIGETLVDFSIATQPTDKHASRPSYDDWTFADARAYLGWLDDMTSEAGYEKPVTAAMVDRASKLGLGGPGKQAILHLLDCESFSDAQKLLGDYRLRTDYDDWSNQRYVREGRNFALYIAGQPTEDLVNQWHREGYFPSHAQIIHRFGTLGAWHEAIGYPSVRGWGVGDYSQWGAAIYMQHPDLRITDKVLDYFSQHGKGPSAHAVNRKCGGIPAFRAGASIALGEIEAEVDEHIQAVKTVALQHASAGILDVDAKTMATLLQDSNFVRLFTRFLLIRAISPGRVPAADFQVALSLKEDDELVEFLSTRNSQVSLGAVMRVAQQRQFDRVLWPKYRFQNVSFVLPPELINPKVGAPKKERSSHSG